MAPQHGQHTYTGNSRQRSLEDCSKTGNIAGNCKDFQIVELGDN